MNFVYVHSAIVLVASCSYPTDSRPDASPLRDAATDAAIIVDAVAPATGLVLNEVAASGTPTDWFEVVNLGPTTVVLSDYCFVDKAADFAKCKTFASATLQVGARTSFEVSDTASGFKLASDEELWIYRNSDKALVDGVDWGEGQSPVQGSFARVPDGRGQFMTVATTRDAAN
jgi:hypothetical protein